MRPGTKFTVGIIETIRLFQVEKDEKNQLKMKSKRIDVDSDFHAKSVDVITPHGTALWLVGLDKGSGELVGSSFASLIDEHNHGRIDIDVDFD